jgi:hypothetical protein
MFGKEVLHELQRYPGLRKHIQMMRNMVWSIKCDDLRFLFHPTLLKALHVILVKRDLFFICYPGPYFGAGDTTHHLTSSRIYFRRIIRSISKRNPWNQKHDDRPNPIPFPSINASPSNPLVTRYLSRVTFSVDSRLTFPLHNKASNCKLSGFLRGA